MKTFRYLIAGLLLLAALPSQSKEEEISVSRSWGKLSGTLTVPDEGSDAAARDRPTATATAARA